MEMTSIIKKTIPLAASLLLLVGSPAFAAIHHPDGETRAYASIYSPRLAPSSIRTETSRHYCLNYENNDDCGFTTLEQCEETASGGLGQCHPSW
jgi:hypothetical protein